METHPKVETAHSDVIAVRKERTVHPREVRAVREFHVARLSCEVAAEGGVLAAQMREVVVVCELLEVWSCERATATRQCVTHLPLLFVFTDAKQGASNIYVYF